MKARPKTEKLEAVRNALGLFHILIKAWGSTGNRVTIFCEESSINCWSSIDLWNVYYIRVDVLREDDCWCGAEKAVSALYF